MDEATEEDKKDGEEDKEDNGEEEGRHVTFAIDGESPSENQIEESKRLIREEIGSSSDEEENSKKVEAGDQDENSEDGEAESGDPIYNSDGEFDNEAYQAAQDAKRAKKLLPKKVKAAP